MLDLQRFLTFRQWPRLTGPLARTEVLAGLTVALVMIPQAVAYAGLAGMPLVTGLYTCLIPALLAVLFGSANRLSVGPAALTCVLIGASLTGMAEPGSPEWVALAVWLSLLSGAIQLLLGLGSYETAWAMLHRFRRAMVRPERERLKGVVEVDETYLALTDRENPISAVGRKSNTSKVLVAIAVELHEPKGFGRIRLRRIDNDAESCVVPFVQDSIEPGAQVRTDGSAAYRSLTDLGYAHQRRVMLGSDTPAHVSMAGVHRVASLVKRWMLGTHHGSVQPEHLDAYLDEFVFRFNRRTSGSRGLLFYRLLQQAVVTDPYTYADVVRKAPRVAQNGVASLLDGYPV